MKNLLLLTLLLVTASVNAQVFDVDTILWNGPKENRVNLVIVGDGYTASQQDIFMSDATLVSDAIFNTSPYLAYRNYFNVIAIKVISLESGASHEGVSSDNACGTQPVEEVDNYFGSSFDCGGGAYHRLLCATKSFLIPGVLAANWPAYDQVLVITNTGYYGGAGGQYAVSSMHPAASEIAIHEVGHSFAALADEYWAGPQYATDSKPNMTSNNNISTVKWNEWVGTDNTGLYPHSGDPAWFKPVTGQCKMEYLGTSYPFCPVCREAHILRTLNLTVPYDSFIPSNTIPLNTLTSTLFDIESVMPQPNTLRVQWELNGNLVKTGLEDSLTIPFDDFQSGMNVISATMLDTSGFIRNENHVSAHSYVITWSINKTALGIESLGQTEDDITYELFPNPLESRSYFRYDIKSAGNVSVRITDLQGKQIAQLVNELQSGEQTIEIDNASLQLPAGIYLISLEKDNKLLITERLSVR